MHYLSLDYLVVYASLLITLVIGLWLGRRIRETKPNRFPYFLHG